MLCTGDEATPDDTAALTGVVEVEPIDDTAAGACSRLSCGVGGVVWGICSSMSLPYNHNTKYTAAMPSTNTTATKMMIWNSALRIVLRA